MRICPAIDRHDDPHSFRAQAQQGWRVRAVALAQAVRHIDPGSAADRREKPRQQRGRGRAVDVVIAKYGDRLAVAHGVDEPGGRSLHVAQMRGIGQLVAQARRQKTRCLVEIDTALSEQAPDDFGQSQPLGDRLCFPRIAGPQAPAAAAN